MLCIMNTKGHPMKRDICSNKRPILGRQTTNGSPFSTDIVKEIHFSEHKKKNDQTKLIKHEHTHALQMAERSTSSTPANLRSTYGMTKILIKEVGENDGFKNRLTAWKIFHLESEQTGDFCRFVFLIFSNFN